jgi:hypothetical protein
MVKVGTIAVDGSKVPAAVNEEQTLDYEQIARHVLAEAKAVDAAEDELYGDKRGDETSCVIHEGPGVVKGRLRIGDVRARAREVGRS